MSSRQSELQAHMDIIKANISTGKAKVIAVNINKGSGPLSVPVSHRSEPAGTMRSLEMAHMKGTMTIIMVYYYHY